jgi:hypothetical protein
MARADLPWPVDYFIRVLRARRAATGFTTPPGADTAGCGFQLRDLRQTNRGGLIHHGSRRSCQMFIEYAERLVKAGVATSRQLKPKINIMPPRTTSMSRYDSQPNASGRAGRSKRRQGLRHSRSRLGYRVRRHRAILQSNAPPSDFGRPQTYGHLADSSFA